MRQKGVSANKYLDCLLRENLENGALITNATNK